MANLLTKLNLCNQALRLIGDSPVTTLASTNVARVNTFNEHYATLRDELLESHYWNFATVRTIVKAYQEPEATLTPAATTGDGVLFTASEVGVFGLGAVGQVLKGVGDVDGVATISDLVTTTPAGDLTPGTGALTPGQTGVIFTSDASVLASGDLGKLIVNLAGNGVARVTSVTDVTHVVATIETAWDSLTEMASGDWQYVATDEVTADISEDFADTSAIAPGSWRLYNEAPEWGFGYRLNVPEDLLQIQRVRHSMVYRREGEFFVSDEETLPLTYTRRVTDITRWPTYFVGAFVAAMVARMAEPQTGQRAKQVDWLSLADAKLRHAKMLDGQEGSAPILRANDLIIARRGGRPTRTTEE